MWHPLDLVVCECFGHCGAAIDAQEGRLGAALTVAVKPSRMGKGLHYLSPGPTVRQESPTGSDIIPTIRQSNSPTVRQCPTIRQHVRQ